MSLAYRLAIALAFGCCLLTAQERATPTAFDSGAFAALPVEAPYTFHRVLSDGFPREHRDPAEQPDAGEMALPAQGWSLIISSNAGPVLRQAAADFRDYLDRSMQVRMSLENGPCPRLQRLSTGRSWPARQKT